MNYGIDQQVFPHHADATIVIPALASSFLFPDGYSALSAPVVAGHDVFEALPPPLEAHLALSAVEVWPTASAGDGAGRLAGDGPDGVQRYRVVLAVGGGGLFAEILMGVVGAAGGVGAGGGGEGGGMPPLGMLPAGKRNVLATWLGVRSMADAALDAACTLRMAEGGRGAGALMVAAATAAATTAVPAFTRADGGGGGAPPPPATGGRRDAGGEQDAELTRRALATWRSRHAPPAADNVGGGDGGDARGGRGWCADEPSPSLRSVLRGRAFVARKPAATAGAAAAARGRSGARRPASTPPAGAAAAASAAGAADGTRPSARARRHRPPPTPPRVARREAADASAVRASSRGFTRSRSRPRVPLVVSYDELMAGAVAHLPPRRPVRGGAGGGAGLGGARRWSNDAPDDAGGGGGDHARREVSEWRPPSAVNAADAAVAKLHARSSEHGVAAAVGGRRPASGAPDVAPLPSSPTAHMVSAAPEAAAGGGTSSRCACCCQAATPSPPPLRPTPGVKAADGESTSTITATSSSSDGSGSDGGCGSNASADTSAATDMADADSSTLLATPSRLLGRLGGRPGEPRERSFRLGGAVSASCLDAPPVAGGACHCWRRRQRPPPAATAAHRVGRAHWRRRRQSAARGWGHTPPSPGASGGGVPPATAAALLGTDGRPLPPLGAGAPPHAPTWRDAPSLPTVALRALASLSPSFAVPSTAAARRRSGGTDGRGGGGGRGVRGWSVRPGGAPADSDDWLLSPGGGGAAAAATAGRPVAAGGAADSDDRLYFQRGPVGGSAACARAGGLGWAADADAWRYWHIGAGGEGGRGGYAARAAGAGWADAAAAATCAPTAAGRPWGVGGGSRSPGRVGCGATSSAEGALRGAARANLEQKE
ncbi:hypothetical protein BU14_0414s0016 [Porphyra umbilicalis]|uniref:DAGKc domain-containing protein n=1 Tax=Porphyra umbilicalis TaxID=2786 RepID=A0A1X6NVT3_PORUM|nr:hypothetical protein BU14_0414s0016 [Porphyra umbilicalis]|eukprot:OSX72692.1 hypothetical protein BU14_0414s0016 [Porphyra umbilicalis]